MYNCKAATLDAIAHDLRTTWQDMQTAAASAAHSHAERARALVDDIEAAKLTGNRAAFVAAQEALKALVQEL